MKLVTEMRTVKSRFREEGTKCSIFSVVSLDMLNSQVEMSCRLSNIYLDLREKVKLGVKNNVHLASYNFICFIW